VIVETDPPLLCLLGGFLQRWRGCRLIVYLQDIYPDVAVALGKLPAGWPTTMLRRWFFGVYRRADQVVVLSRDMQSLLLEAGVAPDKISIVPNWVDTRLVQPTKRNNRFRAQHQLGDKFVVMYSGNLGLSQGLHHVLAAADRLRDRQDIVFLLVGDGASKPALQQQAQTMQLENVRFLDYQPKGELAQSLSAADLHLVTLDPRISRHLMPSKFYGILASGTPLLVIGPTDCELSQVTIEEEVGWIVPSADPEALAATILNCAEQRETLAAMGERAARLAVERYDRRVSTNQFAQVVAHAFQPDSSLQGAVNV
jgi:glycosyltransferase involved in cell wall biosynthesis